MSRNYECNYRTQTADETPQSALKRENTSLRKSNVDLVEALDLLRILPKDKAAEILTHLRSSADVLSALHLMVGKAQNSPLISDRTMAQGPLPFIESGLEFEFMIEHQMAYPTLPPIDSGTAGIDLFTQPEAFDRMDDYGIM